jgi:hypothetical protein
MERHRLTRTSSTHLKDLNFKVDPRFHYAFRIAAHYQGLTMKAFLEGRFASWMEAYPDSQLIGMLRRILEGDPRKK